MTAPAYRIVGDRTQRTVNIGLSQPYPTAILRADQAGGTRNVVIANIVVTTDEHNTVESIHARSPELAYPINYSPSWHTQPPEWLRDLVTSEGLTMWAEPEAK